MDDKATLMQLANYLVAASGIPLMQSMQQAEDLLYIVRQRDAGEPVEVPAQQSTKVSGRSGRWTNPQGGRNG